MILQAKQYVHLLKSGGRLENNLEDLGPILAVLVITIWQVLICSVNRDWHRMGPTFKAIEAYI